MTIITNPLPTRTRVHGSHFTGRVPTSIYTQHYGKVGAVTVRIGQPQPYILEQPEAVVAAVPMLILPIYPDSFDKIELIGY